MLGRQRGWRRIIEHRVAPRYFARRYFRSGLHFGAPLNGQTGRAAVIEAIIHTCQILRIVETGSYLGASTAWFAGLGLPVATVEITPLFAHFCELRVRHSPNVRVVLGDSVSFLNALARQPERHDATLFYLDAHWWKPLPLGEELRTVFTSFPNSVVVIDDFAVPDDAGYGFDDYGPGQRLDMDYVGQQGIGGLAAFFPVMRSEEETGARRGSVILARHADMIIKLDSIALLRRAPSEVA